MLSKTWADNNNNNKKKNGKQQMTLDYAWCAKRDWTDLSLIFKSLFSNLFMFKLKYIFCANIQYSNEIVPNNLLDVQSKCTVTHCQ